MQIVNWWDFVGGGLLMISLLSGSVLAFFLFREIGNSQLSLGAKTSGAICAIAVALLVIEICLSFMFGATQLSYASDEFCRTETYLVGKTAHTRNVCITPVPVTSPTDKR